MTEPTTPDDTPVTEVPDDVPIPVDDIAAFALVTDEGPEALDVEDEKPGPEINSSARPEDGVQDVSQNREGAV